MATAEEIARAVGQVYAGIERELLVVLAQRLGRGLDRPEWAEEKRREIGAIRLAAERIIGRLNRSRHLQRAVVDAWRQGERDARADLEALARQATSTQIDAAALAALATELAGEVQPRHLAILRGTLDAYRAVIAAAAPLSISGVVTRRQAAQRALWEFADRGIASFTDRAGRRWDLASYAEMATRTAAARAMVTSRTERLAANGVRLVVVSDSPQECALCRPWEGKILATRGRAGVFSMEHATRDGVQVRVEVAATLAEARLAGLLHPNCTHSVRGYLPGVTRLPTNTENPTGDEARQRLRALERRVRKWRAREAAAVSGAGRARAKAGLNRALADLREHVATTEAKRQPHRERLGAAR